MRSTLFVLAALPVLAVGLALAPLGDQPSFHVAKGVKLVKTFEQTTTLELEDIHIEFGDEEVSREDLGDVSMDVEAKSVVVVTDEYGAVNEGRPSSVRRTFDELTNEQATTSEGEEGPEEHKTEDESKLSGKTVVFTWNDEEHSYSKKFDGDGADEELLAPLVEDTDLRAFLPGKSVAAGDEWDIEAANFDFWMNPAGDVALTNAEDDEDSAEVEKQLRANLEGSIKATYKGERDEGGVTVGVIALVCKVQSKSETSTDQEGAKATKLYELAFELEGEILWDLKAGRPHSGMLSGRSTVTMDDHTEHEFEGESFSVRQKIVLGGEVRFSAAYATAE